MATAHPSSAVSVIRELRKASGKATRAPLERALAEMPSEEVVPALSAALRSERKSSTFKVLTRLLAERGGDVAAAELVRQVRENRKFPKLAVRALARCEHPERLRLLVELMRSGDDAQWPTAVDALVKLNRVESIEPICRTMGELEGYRKLHANSAIHRMGRADDLAMRALLESSLTDAACARAILALDTLPVYVFPLTFRSFDGERFLTRLTDNGSPLGIRAAAVLKRMREHRTLLRSSGAAPEGELLRPSSGSARAPSDELLRAADPHGSTCRPRGGLLSRLRMK